MSDEPTQGRSGTGSLEEVREVDVADKSTGKVFVEQLVRRWKTMGGIAVLLGTTALLYILDSQTWEIQELGMKVPWSKDTVVFAALTLLLAAYFVVTLRNDIKME